MEPRLLLFFCLVIGRAISETSVHSFAGPGPPPRVDGDDEALIDTAAAPAAFSDAPDNGTMLQFIREPLSQVVANGGRAELGCAVDSRYAGVTAEWLHAGQQVVSTDRKFARSDGVLIIDPVKRRRDQGVYQCRVSWRHGYLLSRPAQLTVASVSRRFSASPDDISAPAGGTALLRCQLDSVPPARISWLRDGAALDVNQTERYTSDVAGQLAITELTPQDAGLYSCVGVNTVLGRQRSSGSGSLTVTAGSGSPRAPRLLSLLPPVAGVNVTANGSLVLPCVADGHPPPTIDWRRADGAELPAGAETTSAGSLRLTNLQFSDSGVYICAAVNSAGRSTRQVAVSVLVPPVIVSQLSPVLERRPGRLIRLQCDAVGQPTPTVTWLKDSRRITSDGRVRATDGELFISNMQSTDAGTYQCVVYNSVGYAAAAVLLTIARGATPLPPPPTGLRATNVTARAALIQWQVTGNITPLGYTVHYLRTDGSEPETTVVVPNNTYWLRQLQPYTNYTVFVRTYILQMASDSSRSITLLTAEDVPSQSPAVSLVALSPTTLNVSWEPLRASVSNGVITSYRIISQRTGERDTASMVQVDASRRFFVIEDLTPGRTYDVRVLAATSAGYPAPSPSDGDGVLQRMPPASAETDRRPRPPHFNLVVTNHTTILITFGHGSGAGGGSGADSGVAPVASYVVVYRRQDQGRRLSAPIRLSSNTTEYHLTDLAPRTFYEVHVRAVAADGQQAESVKTIATLAVEAVPVERLDRVVLEPPTGLNVRAVNDSAVEVSWEQPPSTRTIQYFTVKYRPLRRDAGPYTRLRSTSRGLSITGLEPYTYYEFSVRSHDAEDHFGPYSEAKKVRTLEGAPSPPENVTWTALDASRIRVRWRTPRHPHGVLSGYRVLYSPDRTVPSDEWQVADVPPEAGTAVQIPQLVPNQQYWLVVHARTAAALGEPSTPIEFQIRAVLEGSGTGDRHTARPIDTPTYAAVLATVMLVLVLAVLLVIWWRRRRRAHRPPSSHQRPHMNGSCPAGTGSGAGDDASEAHEMEPLAPVLTHVPPAAANRQLDTKGGHTHAKPVNGRANGFVHPLYAGSAGRGRHGSGGGDANESRLSLINNNSSALNQGGSSDHLPP